MELFNIIKEPLSKENLIQVTENVCDVIEVSRDIDFNFEKLKTDLEKVGLSIENLYLASEGFYPMWYIEDFAYIPIPNLDISTINVICNRNQLDLIKERLQKNWEDQNYESFFSYLESQFRFDVFFRHIDEIPEEKQYEIFKDLYVSNEYGFQDLDRDLVSKLFLSNTDKSFIKHLPVDTDGYVTIYRGGQDKSASPDEAYSWTLKYEIAQYFALRFDSKESYIVKAKVKATDIVDYLSNKTNSGRGEEEILVLPHTVKEIKNMGFYNLDDAMYTELKENGIIDLYKKYSQKHLKGSWFHKPEGIHGKRHIKRVLFLSLIMSHIDELTDEDRQILIYASLYHDIGREHDWEDEEHGYESVLKMEELKLTTKGLNEDEVHILKVIMKYHCIRDSVGVEAILSDEKINNTERALDLFKRFKDCDGLDRVRLGDLDARYLRTETAKDLTLLAHQLLRNIE